MVGRYVMFALVAVLALTGCSSEEPVAGADAAGEDDPNGDDAAGGDDFVATDVRLAIGSDQGTLTPYTYSSGLGWSLMGLVSDTLLALDASNQPRPLLAERMDVSDDGTTYTITLRDDVTWHDGEPFDADDVAFTFAYAAEHRHSRWTPAVSGVTGVDADRTTVTITLDQASPDFLVRTLADMPMLAEHLWADVDDPDAASIDLAVGTGPYRLVDYRQDERYVLEANDDYFLGAPRVGAVEVVVIDEPATAFAALQTGEIDASAIPVEAQLVGRFEADPETALASGAGFRSELLQFNTERAPLDRPDVRRAIALAVDPQELVDVVLLGAGRIGNPGFLHPDSPLSATTLAHDHDPAAARALLDDLGAVPGPDGVRVLDGEALSFELVVYANNPPRIRSAELIAEMLDEIGVEVVVRTMEDASLDELVWPGFDVANGRDFDLAMWGWSPPVMLDAGRLGALVHGDPGIGTFNVGGLADPATDAAVEAVAQASDVEARTSAIAEVQRRIAEQIPFVTLFYGDLQYAYRPEVYDGWVFQDGQGILSKLSFVDLPT